MNHAHALELSTHPVCDVCGDEAPRYVAIVDHNGHAVSACDPCAARVAPRVAEARRRAGDERARA